MRTIEIFKTTDSIGYFGNTNTINNLEMLRLELRFTKGDSKALILF